jgi:hypothetical protein
VCLSHQLQCFMYDMSVTVRGRRIAVGEMPFVGPSLDFLPYLEYGVLIYCN